MALHRRSVVQKLAPVPEAGRGLFELMSKDTQGISVLNFMINHGLDTWEFYPPFVIHSLFPDLAFVDQPEWEIFDPFLPESRRPKKGGEAIDFLQKIFNNLKLKPVVQGHGLLVLNSFDWTFKDLCTSVWLKGHKAYSVLADPALHALANEITQGQFERWVFHSAVVTPTPDPRVGWKCLANFFYMVNLAGCHSQHVIQHVQHHWHHKIAAVDRMNVVKFAKSMEASQDAKKKKTKATNVKQCCI